MRTSRATRTRTRASTPRTALPRSSSGSTARCCAPTRSHTPRATTRVHWLAPIVADAEAGFGGPLNAYEMMKSFIEAGAAAVHFEDQLSSEKKCGHLGGKVLVPTTQHIRTLIAARLAADVADVPTLVVARTDALSAVAPDERHRRAPTVSSARGAHPGGLLPCPRRHRRGDRPRHRLCPLLRPDLVRDRAPGPGRGREIRSRDPRAVPRPAARLQLLAVVQLAQAPERCPDRRLPTRSRVDGLPLPVHHARRLPRRQPVDVRTGARVSAGGDARVRSAPGTRVRARGRRVHRRPPPARGRRRLLRRDARRRSPAAPRRRSRCRARPRRSSSRRRASPAIERGLTLESERAASANSYRGAREHDVLEARPPDVPVISPSRSRAASSVSTATQRRSTESAIATSGSTECEDSFVLKVGNAADPVGVVEMQVLAMEHAIRADATLPIPQPAAHARRSADGPRSRSTGVDHAVSNSSASSTVELPVAADPPASGDAVRSGPRSPDSTWRSAASRTPGEADDPLGRDAARRAPFEARVTSSRPPALVEEARPFVATVIAPAFGLLSLLHDPR